MQGNGYVVLHHAPLYDQVGVDLSNLLQGVFRAEYPLFFAKAPAVLWEEDGGDFFLRYAISRPPRIPRSTKRTDRPRPARYWLRQSRGP